MFTDAEKKAFVCGAIAGAHLQHGETNPIGDALAAGFREAFNLPDNFTSEMREWAEVVGRIALEAIANRHAG